jgi:hypothetical protein
MMVLSALNFPAGCSSQPPSLRDAESILGLDVNGLQDPAVFYQGLRLIITGPRGNLGSVKWDLNKYLKLNY